MHAPARIPTPTSRRSRLPAVEVQALCAFQLLLLEVCGLIRRTSLEHDDSKSATGEHTSGDAAAGAGPNDADVRVELRLLADRRDVEPSVGRFRLWRRMISDGRPDAVLSGLISNGVIQKS
jgi:hypothetical protein